MDVVLVGPDLVGPGPFLQIGVGGYVIEAAVPEDLCGDGGAKERAEEGGFGEHADLLFVVKE